MTSRPASTVQVRAPLPDTLLSQYAQFYTAAGVKQCGEAGCTTIWDEAMIAEEMARRDASLYTEALLRAKGLTAEAYAFTWRDGMCISLTHRDAGSAELSTLIASLLQRVHTIDPVIGTAMFHLDDEDVATVGPALVEAGFEETGRRAIYHLLPDTEPATVPG
ncbi:hypothetical protein HT585_04295 [Ensifer sp. HO-A22]|uniref:Uncharacterized protein n=1 Tax=Ensifer oleiphilus TaxID=2742698 RepID=A0A7Y6Q3A7_9HYPH|nr:hypothetical protein [Ensifer oleiphilus]NVD38065.1 hypothetical protein [Ensifer oleiphilus]